MEFADEVAALRREIDRLAYSDGVDYADLTARLDRIAAWPLQRETRGAMGPYETERDALREPMPREVRAAQTGGAERYDATGLRLTGAGADIVLRHLADACEAAGVEIADYDWRILAWLARWEPSTAQVVIGLVTRAHEAGKQGRPDDEAPYGCPTCRTILNAKAAGCPDPWHLTNRPIGSTWKRAER